MAAKEINAIVQMAPMTEAYMDVYINRDREPIIVTDFTYIESAQTDISYINYVVAYDYEVEGIRHRRTIPTLELLKSSAAHPLAGSSNIYIDQAYPYVYIVVNDNNWSVQNAIEQLDNSITSGGGGGGGLEYLLDADADASLIIHESGGDSVIDPGEVHQINLGDLNSSILASSDATIAGGEYNDITGSNNAFVGGGERNYILGSEWATIGGGFTNGIGDVSEYSIIVGGNENNISNSLESFIGGGKNHSMINGSISVIGGGDGNAISGGEGNTIAGGEALTISNSDYTAMSGGSGNTIGNSSHYAFMGAGLGNEINNAQDASIVGGTDNKIDDGSYSIIGGGDLNYIGYGSVNAAIVAGVNNRIDYDSYRSFIGAGESNYIGNSVATVISGGNQNTIEFSEYSVIAGGNTNTITSALHAAISGGNDNTVEGEASSISSGESNHIGASADFSIIGSGISNVLTGNTYQAILGGSSNEINNGQSSSVVGGEDNVIEDSTYAFIGGGVLGKIEAGANYSTILGGERNKVIKPSATILSGKYGYADSYGEVVETSHDVILDNYSSKLTTESVIYQLSAATGNFSAESLYLDGDSGSEEIILTTLNSEGNSVGQVSISGNIALTAHGAQTDDRGTVKLSNYIFTCGYNGFGVGDVDYSSTGEDISTNINGGFAFDIVDFNMQVIDGKLRLGIQTNTSEDVVWSATVRATRLLSGYIDL